MRSLPGTARRPLLPWSETASTCGLSVPAKVSMVTGYTFRRTRQSRTCTPKQRRLFSRQTRRPRPSTSSASTWEECGRSQVARGTGASRQRTATRLEPLAAHPPMATQPCTTSTFFTTITALTSHSDSHTDTRTHVGVLCASLSRALVKQTRREKEEW